MLKAVKVLACTLRASLKRQPTWHAALTPLSVLPHREYCKVCHVESSGIRQVRLSAAYSASCEHTLVQSAVATLLVLHLICSKPVKLTSIVRVMPEF